MLRRGGLADGLAVGVVAVPVGVAAFVDDADDVARTSSGSRIPLAFRMATFVHRLFGLRLYRTILIYKQFSFEFVEQV